jgi:flagellar biosynthesis protein FlhF
MVTKTFKSETVIQTLQMVQAELGASAIVVSMRDVPLGPMWNPWQKAGVEVVATLPEETSGGKVDTTPVLRPTDNGAGFEFVEERPEIEWEPLPKKDPSKLPPPIKLKSIPDLATPLPTSIFDEAESTAPNTATQAPAESDRYVPPTLKKIQAQLIRQGVESSLIENLLDVTLETLSPSTLADADACKKSIIELMGAGLRVQKGAGTFLSQNVVCVVGASGSGKTSVVAKLALFFSQNLHKTVTWVCADTVRMGAVAEARAYTDALGPELKLVYTPADLGEILKDPQESDLFLVDTPGYNPCNENQMIELGALLAEMPNRCTYLAAPATTKESDLFQASATLGMFDIDGLIITKLDETHSFGNLYNFARKNQFPLSFFTTGKEAARNLEVADPARLVAALFGKEWNK